MTDRDAFEHQPPVHSDDTCVRCGYSLFDIKDDQPCPECGLLAERSRSPSDQLRDSRPDYLRRLSTGVWLMIAAMAVAAAWIFLPELVTGTTYQWLRISVRSLHNQFIGFYVTAVLLLIGAWLITSRETQRGTSRVNQWLRYAAFLPLLVIALCHVSYYESTRGPGSNLTRFAVPGSAGGVWLDLRILAATWLPWLLSIFGPLLFLPLPILLFGRLAQLGRRLLSRQLHEHCLIVGYGITGTLLLGFIGGTFLNHRDELGFPSSHYVRHTVEPVLTLILVTASLLFSIWCVFLLFRFAIAFWSESRQLKRAWAAADRSTPIEGLS